MKKLKETEEGSTNLDSSVCCLGATRRRYNTWRFAFDYGIILVNIHSTLAHRLTHSFAFASVFVFVSIHSLSSLSDHIILTCFVCLSCQIACCLRLLTMQGPHPPARAPAPVPAPSPAAPLPLLTLQAQLSTLPSSPLHSLPAFNYLFTLADFTTHTLHFFPLLPPPPPGWSGPTRACLFVSRQALGLMPP